MLINGEKYACDACIRGHRVSSCQHHDRPLSHINRKGRPVSQCPHCRGLRKSRTSHVSCQCGEKPHSKNDCKSGAADKGGRKQCCCGHGSRCICGPKRDPNLPTVPEGGPVPNGKSNFHGKLDAGPHRPKAKQNKTSKRAHPYPLPRSHTIQSTADLASRSVDSLALPDMALSRSVPGHQDSITSAPRHLRQVRSEHGSPVLGISRLDAQVPPIDIPYSHFDQANLPSPAVEYQRQWPGLYYPEIDHTLDASSLGGQSVDWSTFDLGYGSDSLYSQPPSYSSFDYANMSHPGLSRSSSHDTSEPDEFTSIGMPMQPNKQKGLEIRTVSHGSDSEGYPLNTSPSRIDMPQPRLSGLNHLNSLDLDMYWRVTEGMNQPSSMATMPLGTEMQQYSMAPTYPTSQPSTSLDNTVSFDAPNIFTSAESADPIWIPSASPYPPVLSPVSVEAGQPDQNQWRS